MTPSATKLLYVITDLQQGGVPLHLFRLSRAMRQRGFSIIVASLASRGPVGQRMREDGVEVRACEGCCGWDFRVLGRLARIVEDTKPDIIHSFLFHANQAVRLASLEVGFPSRGLVGEIQTVEVERPWHLWVERLTHGLGGLMVGNSPSVVEHLATRGGVPRESLRLVRGGVDPARFQGAPPVDRSILCVNPESPLVVWVGRLDPVKGLETLIDAFEGVARTSEAHLVLVGQGPLHGRLVECINRAGLASRVHLLGARDDVPSLLAAADVFAFPSRTEGLPNALLEAMASACPIVATDVPGNRDLIEHEHTGLLVPYGDTVALGEAITRLIVDGVLARDLGQRARACVGEHWLIDETYDSYAALYRSMLAK